MFFEAFIDAAKNIDLDNILWRVLSRHTDDLVDLQRNRISQGKRTDNTDLPLPYSPSHVRVRLKFGRPLSPKDLNLTGQHYAKMYVVANKDGIIMGSNDWKSMILESEWGKIYGLSESDIDIILWQWGVADEIVLEYQRQLFA